MKLKLKKPTVYVAMSGDLIHHGHINILKIAKKYGYVTLGILTNKAIRSYKNPPIMNYNQRKIVLESIRYVDKVIPDAPVIITEEYLEEHKIDLVIHAHKIEEDERYKKMYSVPTRLNKFIRFEPTEGISTTDIIERMKCRK